MFCPICNEPISKKDKKQIKHLRTHSVDELCLTVLWLRLLVDSYERLALQKQNVVEQPGDQPATLALDDPAGLWPVPGDVFTLVEEDNEEDSNDSDDTYAWIDKTPAPDADEEDSDEAMAAAGMEQCALCGLWVWPGDMPYHLAVACAEVGEQPGPDNGVHDPGDVLPGDFDNIGEYAEVKYIRIAADGPEYQLLNALAQWIGVASHVPTSADLPYTYSRYGSHPMIPAEDVDLYLLNALALYSRRSMGQ